VLNQFFRVVGWQSIDVVSWLKPGQAPDFSLLIPIFIIAFIVGYLFDSLSYKFFGFFYRLRKRQKASEKSLTAIKERYPNMDIKFNANDWGTLFVFVRIRNLELSQMIDKFNADSIMFRNIAFGMFLFSIVYAVNFFYGGNWMMLIYAIVTFFFFTLAISRSNDLRERFFKQIFRASLAYGKSVEEVIDYENREPKLQKLKTNKKSRKAS
jgi:hypothetical protein